MRMAGAGNMSRDDISGVPGAGYPVDIAGVAGACPPLGFTVGPILGTYLYSVDGALPYWFAFGCYFLLFFFTMKFKDRK